MANIDMNYTPFHHMELWLFFCTVLLYVLYWAAVYACALAFGCLFVWMEFRFLRISSIPFLLISICLAFHRIRTIYNTRDIQ